jgi:hypothetical protein
MERRALLVGLAGGLLAAPLAAEAQETGKVWRIGLLVGGPAPGEHPCVLALRRGLTPTWGTWRAERTCSRSAGPRGDPRTRFLV